MCRFQLQVAIISKSVYTRETKTDFAECYSLNEHDIFRKSLDL